MDIERNKVTGSCLRQMRKEAGLTQLQVALRMRRTQSFVSKVENADRELSLVEAFLYAAALDASYDDLIGRVHDGLVDSGLYPTPEAI